MGWENTEEKAGRPETLKLQWECRRRWLMKNGLDLGFTGDGKRRKAEMSFDQAAHRATVSHSVIRVMQVGKVRCCQAQRATTPPASGGSLADHNSTATAAPIHYSRPLIDRPAPQTLQKLKDRLRIGPSSPAKTVAPMARKRQLHALGAAMPSTVAGRGTSICREDLQAAEVHSPRMPLGFRVPKPAGPHRIGAFCQ